uniref:RNA_ligase domain-containing protein n=1 Tax=Strongyloides stercoralis TaxID=6248 RepID=A0A0K0EA61_STRER
MNATPKVAVKSHQRTMLELLSFQIIYKFFNTKENIISLLVESKFNEIDKGLVVYSNLFKVVPFNYEPLEPNEIKLNYLLDKDAKILAEIAKTGKWSLEQKLMISGTYKSKLDAISINDGLLFVEEKLFVPKGLIEKMIEWLHRHHQSYNSKATLAANERVFNKGLSAKELFFGYESNTPTLMKKYSDWNQPMDCNVLFKMKWGDKDWLQGKAFERLSENAFVIEFENKLYDKSYEEMVNECLTMTQMDKINGKSNRAMRKPLEVVKNYELVCDKADSEEEFQKIVDIYTGCSKSNRTFF